MPSRQIRAFISSRMQELAAEREAIKASLDKLHIDAFIFEKDAGARAKSIQETYLQEEEAADLYVGVFWKGYGPHTIEEFEEATILGMDCLLFEKHVDIEGSRDPHLQAFLDRVGDPECGLTICRFKTLDELSTEIAKAVLLWKAEIGDDANRSRATAIYHGVPSRPLQDFVGRGPEIQRMVRSLRSAEDLAIEGLPGVGKTSLAVMLAHHPGIRRRYKDGVLWASLGPNADAASALANWARALENAGLLKDDISRLPALSQRTQALRDAIGERRLLLVIDDVWQIADGLLLRCGGRNCVHLLTTRDKSIARTFSPTLAAALTSLGREQAYELINRLAPETCRAAPDVVRKLLAAVGGLPLAVRLIAGHLAAFAGAFAGMFSDLSAEALGEMSNVQERLRLAEKRLGTLQDNKISLQDTIALSLEGLPEATSRAFYKLGAFAAKPEQFTREAAEAVTEAGSRNLVLLAARNLLEIDEEKLRISIHPIVADVARTQLDQATIARHRDYYISLVRANIDDWKLVESAYAQIRWAWQHSPEDDVTFLLVMLLENYQTRRGLFTETLSWAERALQAAEHREFQAGAGPLLRALLLTVMGRAQKGMGHLESALQCHREALHLWQASLENAAADLAPKLRSKQIESMVAGALLVAARGEPDLAFEELRKAHEIAEAAEDRAMQAECLMSMSYVLRSDPMRHKQALECIPLALQLYRELGDRSGEANTLTLLGMIHRNLEQPAPALDYLRQALAISEDTGSRDQQAEARIGMASLYRQQGRMDEALMAAEEALRMSIETGDRGLQVDSLNLLGNIHGRLKQPERALEYFKQRLSFEEEEGDRLGQASALKDIGRLQREQGNREQALENFRQALALCDSQGVDGKRAKADALSWIGILYGDLGQSALHLEYLQKELAVWRELNSTNEQASLLRWIGSVEKRLEIQERKKAHVQRFGEAVLGKVPAMTRIGVDVPANLSADSEEENRLFHEDLRAYAAGLRRLFSSSNGIPLPTVYLRSNPPSDRAGSYLILIDEVPTVAGVVWPDRRLYPGPIDDLPHVQAEKTVDPQNGNAAAWIGRENWAEVEASGKKLWTPAEYIVRHLESVLRRRMSDFIGHQETIDLLDASVPEAATRMRERTTELSALVVLLMSLADEFVPIRDLKPIVETFEILRKEGRDRLAILEAIRCVPEIRGVLPGNDGSTAFYLVGPRIEQMIGEGIRTADGITYLSFEPTATQQILRLVREAINRHPQNTALLVENPGVRRFTRRLVELEFPNLGVLARQELLGGRDPNIIGSIELQS